MISRLFLTVATLTLSAGPDGALSLLPPPPDDPRTQLYAKRLDFRAGEPLVPVRLMEGASEVQFTAPGRMRVELEGKPPGRMEVPGGQLLRAVVRTSVPAHVRDELQLGEFRFVDKAGLAAERARLTALGLAVRVQTLGTVAGIAGKVLDNRRQLLLLDEPPFASADEARARATKLSRDLAVKADLFETVGEPAHGQLELLDAHGARLGVSEDTFSVEPLDGEGFSVRKVEFGVGYDFHNFEDRSYRGSLVLALDRNGKLAVINKVLLEDLLMGLVPSEIFARAHPEALKAQAVTARGEVLAKIGLRHLADPYLLCSEQHCAVYRGKSGEAASTNEAVRKTRGQALFSKDGKLVNSVYSAVCGGHTESNENVWGGPPDPSLRGRPDWLEATKVPLPSQDLAAFLAADGPAACRLSTFAQPTRYRWERKLSAAEVDARTRALGVGRVQAITVTERGVSGRARALTVSGDEGAAEVRGELEIRKLFGMLNSAMFLVEPVRQTDGPAPHDKDAPISGWHFHGGGWGHGVGMCQTGAVGRAEAGQSYREILRYYFNGAEVAAIY